MKIKLNMTKQATALYIGLGLMSGGIHADFLNEWTFENESAGLTLSLARNSGSENAAFNSGGEGFLETDGRGGLLCTHHVSGVWSNGAVLNAAIEPQNSGIVYLRYDLEYDLRSGTNDSGAMVGIYFSDNHSDRLAGLVLGYRESKLRSHKPAERSLTSVTNGLSLNGTLTAIAEVNMDLQLLRVWYGLGESGGFDFQFPDVTIRAELTAIDHLQLHATGAVRPSGSADYVTIKNIRHAASWSDIMTPLVSAEDESAFAVERALDSATIQYQPGDSSNRVTGTLAFSMAAGQGVVTDWKSSSPLIVDPSGAVYRPRASGYFRGGSIPVVITATASMGNVTQSREFHVLVLPSGDSELPLYMGVWAPFWRARPVIGQWLAGGQGLETIPDPMRRNSFAYQVKELESEIPFADELAVVRLIGGWNEGGGSENPIPADQADLVYRDEHGVLQYRWEKLALRLAPYVNRGYTNLTLVLDNIPYCFPSNIVMESYGQVATPQDFQEWGTFVSNLCVQLVERYGFETANNFRFRQGTEAQNTGRFAGTQEDYFKLYDHSAAAVKGVLPGAQFGPFNNAGGKQTPHLNNVNLIDLARHCATGINHATGEIGSPLDFISISSYVVQVTHPRNPENEVGMCSDFFSWIQAELPWQAAFEIHEFGILRCEADLPSGEPGARGAGWFFHTILGLREQGVDRWYHWAGLDVFRSSRGLHRILNSEGWFLSVLDHTAGGEAFRLQTTSSMIDPGTQVKAIGVLGGRRDWILVGAFNPDRLQHVPETISIRVPLNLLRSVGEDTVLWTSLNQTNAAHYLIRQDLEEAGLLNAAFSAVPEQLAEVRTMTSGGVTSPEQQYLGERVERYEQAVIDSLTLKPFSGTVHTNGGEVVFSVTLTPPETAVICIGTDRTSSGIPYAWLDSHGLGIRGYEHGAATDWDGDGYTAGQEYIAGPNPLDG